MSLIDFLLNLAGLLLWLNWRAVPHDPLHTATPATLAGTLRRAEPARLKRWHFLAALAGLIVVRAKFYQVIGPALDWTATLNLFATRLAFRSDSLNMMLLYSALSFAVWLGVLLLCLLLVSFAGRSGGGQFLAVRLARAHFGFIVDWSPWKRLLLPFVVTLALWWALTWPLSNWGLVSPPGSELIRLAQAALVGAGSYLVWKPFLIAVLGLYLLHNHIYFGRHAFWDFVDHFGRQLLRPLRFVPLRLARLDFAPLIGIALVWSLAQVMEHGVKSPVTRDEHGLPMSPGWGLAGLYERVSR